MIIYCYNEPIENYIKYLIMKHEWQLTMYRWIVWKDDHVIVTRKVHSAQSSKITERFITGGSNGHSRWYLNMEWCCDDGKRKTGAWRGAGGRDVGGASQVYQERWCMRKLTFEHASLSRAGEMSNSFMAR